MTESKYKRIIVAITCGAVILLCFLAFIMVTQFIGMAQAKKEKANLEKEIARYDEMIELGEDTLEARQTRWWIERQARKLGYIYDGDEIIK